MSRTRRHLGSGPDPWPVVDAWAAVAVDPLAMRARWSARAVPVRGATRFVDVLGPAEDARHALRAAGIGRPAGRPVRRALGRTGEVAYRVDDALVNALTAAAVPFRVVTAARRYVWRGAFTGRTVCEISTERGDAGTTIEAWYEPVWVDSLRPRSGGPPGEPRRPTRLLQARASINRLLADLGCEPIATG